MGRRRNPQRKYKKPRYRPDPIQLGRALSRRKAVSLIVGLVLVLLLVLFDQYAQVLPVDDDWRRYHGRSFEVVRVVDGDTLDLRVPDGERMTTRVRLWGVDTPELARGGRPEEDWAREATDFARRIAEGQRVTVHLQRHRLRGGYGRLLAYIELPDGSFLNEKLIENGFSEHDERWSHDRAWHFEALDRGARQNRVGIWSD